MLTNTPAHLDRIHSPPSNPRIPRALSTPDLPLIRLFAANPSKVARYFPLGVFFSIVRYDAFLDQILHLVHRWLHRQAPGHKVQLH